MILTWFRNSLTFKSSVCFLTENRGLFRLCASNHSWKSLRLIFLETLFKRFCYIWITSIVYVNEQMKSSFINLIIDHIPLHCNYGYVPAMLESSPGTCHLDSGFGPSGCGLELVYVFCWLRICRNLSVLVTVSGDPVGKRPSYLSGFLQDSFG